MSRLQTWPGYWCEAFATLDSSDGRSAIIRPMFWLSKVSVVGPEAAVAWVVDRLELFAQLLDGPDIGRADRWTGDEEARWRALLALRAGKRLSFEVTDRDRVHYQAAVCPVRERPRARPHAPPRPRRRITSTNPAPHRQRRKSMQVSIVVAVRGNTGALHGLATAVRAQDYPAGDLELIVVDNHPAPVLPPGPYRLGPMPCRVVHERRPGLSRARNAGIRQASGEIVLITDPDARPEPDWAQRMAAALEATGAYCAGGKVVPYFTGGTAAEVSADVLQLFVPPTWPQATTELTAPYWAVGCNLAIRRSPLPQFDTRLGVTGRRHLSCEDLEFTVRAQRSGRLVVVVPDAVIHRAIHPADLMAVAVWGRALWHGVSVARLLAIHPSADIYDSYRLRDALTPARLCSRTGRRGAVADVARVAGLRAERLRLAMAGLSTHTASAEESATKKEAFHG